MFQIKSSANTVQTQVVLAKVKFLCLFLSTTDTFFSMLFENLPSYHQHVKNVCPDGVWTNMTQNDISNKYLIIGYHFLIFLAKIDSP